MDADPTFFDDDFQLKRVPGFVLGLLAIVALATVIVGIVQLTGNPTLGFVAFLVPYGVLATYVLRRRQPDAIQAYWFFAGILVCLAFFTIFSLWFVFAIVALVAVSSLMIMTKKETGHYFGLFELAAFLTGPVVMLLPFFIALQTQ